MHHLEKCARALVQEAGFDLRSLAYRYAETCWAIGWKRGKTNDLENLGNPFIGGPQHLLEAGITSVEGVGGDHIAVTKLTRLRMRQLSDTALCELGTLAGKDLVSMKALGNKDVVHPEYVPTFEENVSNDARHLLNNMVSAAAVVDTVFSFLAGPDTTVEQLIATIERVLGGCENARTEQFLVSAGSRMSWIGRACQDGSWKESSDFVFFHELQDNTAKIDEYVAIPVLRYLLEDLNTNFGKQS